MDLEELLIMLVVGIIVIYLGPFIISRVLLSNQRKLLEEEQRLDEKNRNLNLEITKTLAQEPEYEEISIAICKKCGFVNSNPQNFCEKCGTSLLAKVV